MKTFSFVALTAAAAVGSAAGQEPEYLGVFQTSAFVSMELFDENAFLESYRTDEVFQIESGTSAYLGELLADPTHSGFQGPNEVLLTSVSVTAQTQTDDAILVESVVNVLHVGDNEIADLAQLLEFLTNKNTTNSEYTALTSLVGLDSVVKTVSFTNDKDTSLLTGGFNSLGGAGTTSDSKYTQTERTLIVVTSVLSFALFTLSVILIWIAGGWLALRRQVKLLLHREEELTRMTMEIKQKATQDTADADGEGEGTPPKKGDSSHCTNPSGILGVNPYYGNPSNALDGLGIKMTPSRTRESDMDSEVATPMSVYSDTGRAPIGITSMRKLLTQRQNKDDGDDNYGIKRLDYDV